MRSINKVILIGNLTRDPELRQTPNGQSVTTFGLATNREWTTKSGDRNNSAEFHECVAWAHLAEICQQYLRKGNLIYIEGYLKTRSWDSPEGIKKFKTEIVVKDMIRLEKRPQGSLSKNDTAVNGDEFVPEEDQGMGNEESPKMANSTAANPTESRMPVGVPASDSPGADPAETRTPVGSISSSSSSNAEDNPIEKDLGL